MTQLLTRSVSAVAIAVGLWLVSMPVSAAATPSPTPPGCVVQDFVVGAASNCAPGSVSTQQLELVCVPSGFPVTAVVVWGPEVPAYLPSIALCPPFYTGYGIIHTH
ncbi:hypothetical protein M2280_006113 [Prescottella agglutinans]|uniref:Secreted protein n=1 Tax=Prescottella agglutinans TaxID=1644129 RepID=A0ABT6MKM4_9NOCA|nr:hypothetical protein [Prescottella agglutinans]